MSRGKKISHFLLRLVLLRLRNVLLFLQEIVLLKVKYVSLFFFFACAGLQILIFFWRTSAWLVSKFWFFTGTCAFLFFCRNFFFRHLNFLISSRNFFSKFKFLISFRNDVNKLIEEVSRVDYMCTGQEHELKALSDRMCDLGQLKETVKVFAEFYFIQKNNKQQSTFGTDVWNLQ